MANQRRIVVLGGGVSGLAFGYYMNAFKRSILTVKGSVLPQITLLEKSSEVGGWMKSHQDESTKAVFEYGPRSLRAVGHEARSSMALAEELGLASEIIAVTRTSPPGKQRLIYGKDKLHPLPTSIMGFLRKFPLINRSMAAVAYNEMKTPPSIQTKNKDESIHSFISRRFGTEVADYVADPFLRGIIAGDSKETSVISMFPNLKAAEDRYGSVIRNLSKVSAPVKGVIKESAVCRRAKVEKWAMWNFKSGLQTLPNALHTALLDQGTELKMDTSCTKLEKSGQGFLVHTADGVVEADAVVAAVNSKIISRLLQDDHPLLSEKLNSLPIHDVATATLEYSTDAASSIPQAFGHLVPSCENEENLGVIYESMVFPQHDRVDNSTKRLTVMIGGAWFDSVLGADPTISTVEEIAIRSVAKQLNISARPVNIKANIIRDAIPQYPIGHSALVAEIDEYIKKHQLSLTLIGPSYDSPGANHCIHRAKVQAMNLLEQWDVIDLQSLVQENIRNES